MEFGDWPAMIAAAGALLLGILGVFVTPAKDRNKTKAAADPPDSEEDGGTPVDWRAEYIAMLKADADQRAALARLEEISRSLGAEKTRLLKTIARRDDKIRQDKELISRLRDQLTSR